MACQSHGSPQDEVARRAQILERLLLSRRAQLLRQVHRHSELPEDAEDALGDACVQFLRHYSGPGEVEDSFHWMLLVSKRCAWEIARRRRERADLAPLMPLDEIGNPRIASERGNAEDLAERSEEADRVIAAIERLPPEERTALLLFGLGFRYEEIGRMRGWSYAKVHRRLSDGRGRVRHFLEEGDSS